MIYEWDPEKAEANLRKHGLSFEEAATVFLQPLAVTYPDPDHSDEEDREITIGHSVKHRVLFVSHCQRGRSHSTPQCTEGDPKGAQGA